MTDYENHVKDKDDANERWGHVAELIQLATDAEENLAENDIEGGGGTNTTSKSPKTTLAASSWKASLYSPPPKRRTVTKCSTTRKTNREKNAQMPLN